MRSDRDDLDDLESDVLDGLDTLDDQAPPGTIPLARARRRRAADHVAGLLGGD